VISRMLNWKVRYHKILKNNPDLLDEKTSILEVGSGGNGLAPYLNRKIFCLDQKFPERIHKNITPIIGSIDDIKYDDDSFDCVVCVDVMEHLSEKIRASALAELIRVAKEKVVLSFPCKEFAEKGEQHLEAAFKRLGVQIPDWLQEHIQNGLPRMADVVSAIASQGYRFSITPNEGFLQHYSGVILDMLFPVSQEIFSELESKAPLEPPINENEWDFYYSFIITIYKKKLPAPTSPRNNTAKAIEASSIYSIYHKVLPTDHLDNIIPIYVGEAAQQVGPSSLTDRLRDGSSLDNERWSELSAIHKIWKEGPKSDVVGFCHYRRLFQSDTTSREINISRSEIEKYRIDKDMFSGMGGDFIITPKKLSISSSVFSQYCVTHNANHICALYNMLEKRRPDLLPYVAEHFGEKLLYANNMFITTWDNFDELCTLWFSILGALESEFPKNSGSRYQRRDLSFLAERMFDIWIRQKIASGVPVVETGIYFVDFEGLDVKEWSPTSHAQR